MSKINIPTKHKKNKKIEIYNEINEEIYEIILDKVNINEENINEILEKLNQYEQDCSKNSKYIEADLTNRKIKEIRDKYFNLKENIIKKEQLKERVEIEKAYRLEYDTFKEKWKKKFEKFDIKITDSKNEMLITHKKFIENGIKTLEDSFININIVPNQKILNLKKIEKTLAKQKKYLDALEIKNECEEEENIIYDRLKQEFNIKKKEFTDEAERKNSKEIQIFLKNLENMKKRLESEKELELSKLNSKYDKLKFDWVNLHKNEKKEVNSNKKNGEYFKNKRIINSNKKINKKLFESNQSSKKKNLLDKLNKTPLKNN